MEILGKQESFFEALWSDYVRVAPQAADIRDFFEKEGEKVVNDHVAFRTFNLEPIKLERLEEHILALGYQRFADYTFPEKHLRAWSYISPGPDLPYIFFSELDVSALSEKSQKIIHDLCHQIPWARTRGIDVFWSGVLWEPIAWEDYLTLMEESEYAAWLAALGFRANHFTIRVNSLKKYSSVESVLKKVESLGYNINEIGGRVKGSSGDLLEQGSTMADRGRVSFAEGAVHVIPTCYCEFALRHKDKKGELFPGFLGPSANLIFDSTSGGL